MKPQAISPPGPVLKGLLNPLALPPLRKYMAPAEAQHLLNHTWELYPAQLRDVMPAGSWELARL
jgi:hypothetical protein